MSGADREHIEDLVIKFILGEANADESQEVKDWCAIDSENQKYLEDVQLIFDRSQLPSEVEFNPDRAWNTISPKITQGGGKTRSIFTIWRVAAGLVLVAAVAYLFYWNLAPADEFVFVADNEVITQTLPDQTEISLNRESEAVVDYNPRKKVGTIQLKGEATISIGEEKDIRWTVEVGDLLIRDIGTIFHVKAYPDSEEIEVSVLEGAVQFFSNQEEGILIQVGEKGIYSKASHTYRKVQADTNLISYKTRSFQFTEESLQSVVELISDVYGKKITLKGPIENCKITVNFEQEEFETILEILSETMGLEVLENGDEIVLQGEGCF